jgi:hypothetical protein
MPTTIAITCPECKKELKGPAEVLGKKIRCKLCGHTFVAKDGGGKKAPPPPPAKAAKAAKPNRPAPTPAKSDLEPPVPGGERDIIALGLKEEDAQGKDPYKLTTISLAPRCPQCAAEMDGEDAIICLECGYNTQMRTRHEIKKTYQSTSMDWILWLTPGILAAFVVLAMLGAIPCIWFVLPPHGNDDTPWYASLPAKIYGSVMCAFIGWICIKFSVRRLIKNPHPPERMMR